MGKAVSQIPVAGQAGAATLTLEPRLDLRAVAPLAEALGAARGADLVLDAGAVIQIGALALQVIRSAARSWAEDGHSLRFENASTDLEDQLVLLGHNPETLTRWEAR